MERLYQLMLVGVLRTLLQVRIHRLVVVWVIQHPATNPLLVVALLIQLQALNLPLLVVVEILLLAKSRLLLVG